MLGTRSPTVNMSDENTEIKQTLGEKFLKICVTDHKTVTMSRPV